MFVYGWNLLMLNDLLLSSGDSPSVIAIISEVNIDSIAICGVQYKNKLYESKMYTQRLCHITCQKSVNIHINDPRE